MTALRSIVHNMYWLCNSFSEKLFQLLSLHDIDTMNWTKCMSKESLKIPANNLFRTVKILKKHFKEIHKANLCNEPNIFKKLINIVKLFISHFVG